MNTEAENIAKIDVAMDNDCNSVYFEGLKIVFPNAEEKKYGDLDVQQAAEKLLEKFLASANSDFSISQDTYFRWLGVPVGKLIAGDTYLTPKVVLFTDDIVDQAIKDKLVDRAQRFVTYYFEEILKPLYSLTNETKLSDTSKKIAESVVKNYGILERRHVLSEVRSLDKSERFILRHLGLRFGSYYLFLPYLLKPAAVSELGLLWKIFHNKEEVTGLEKIVAGLLSGRTSQAVDSDIPVMSYKLSGYRVLGKRAVRVDILERLADMIRPLLDWKEESQDYLEGAYSGQRFFVTPPMLALLGATTADMELILTELGYVSEECDPEEIRNSLEKYSSSKVKKAEPVGDIWKNYTEELQESDSKVSKQQPNINLLWKRSTVKDNNRYRNKDNSMKKPAYKASEVKNRIEKFSNFKNIKTKKEHEVNANTKAAVKENSKPLYKKSANKKDKPIDLDSPFAKLLSLKEKLSDN